MNKSQIIQKLISGSKLTYERFNILPSVTIAQAILETGWLRYCRGNNLFGIKWTRNCGYEIQELKTFEWINGVKTPMICKFRKYKSIDDSLIDHAELLAYSKRYKPVLLAKNYKEACRELYNCGYCTDSNYPEKLISIIEENELNRYDPPKHIRESEIEQLMNDMQQNTDTFHPRINSKEKIKHLQSILNKLKIKDKNNNLLKVDGIYGTLTTSAVTNFQYIVGLTPDGICGTNTWSAIENILKKLECSIKSPPDQKITKYIQWRIGVSPSGIWDEETDNNVKKYQSNCRLKVDGWIGKNTWNKLI